MSQEESQDYNEREVELVKQFYSMRDSDNYFRDFFFPQNISPGIWVKKFITDPERGLSRVSPIEDNTFTATGIDKEILLGAIYYGNHTAVNLVSKTDTTALETFEVVIDWLSPDISAGYTVHKNINANVYASQDAKYGTFDIVFESALGVVGGRSAIRIESAYDSNAPQLYNAAGKPLERLPSSMNLLLGGKKMAEFSIVGYVEESEDLVPKNILPQKSKQSLAVGSKEFSSIAIVSKFMCGMKKGGTLFGIGSKEEFVKFTSEQQIRAAVVLHVAKLFCYASTWRVYFGFLNSLGTAIAFGVPGMIWNNKLFETAKNINTFLGFTFFDVEEEQKSALLPLVDDFTDNNKMRTKDIKDHMKNQFAGWNTDPLRVANSGVQAKRIQGHFFYPTATYDAYIETLKADIVEDKKDLSSDVATFIRLIKENVILENDIAKQFDVDTKADDFVLKTFLDDFEKNFAWNLMNKDAWSVERVKQEIFKTADKIRMRAQKILSLRFVVFPNSSPLYQFIVKLLLFQQLLKGIAYLTEIMLHFGVGREAQTINAPLRASERDLALFVARTLLESIPIERRTSGGKTEEFAAELKKIVDSNGGNGQVPVPDADVLDNMLNVGDNMQIGDVRVITQDEALFGFSEFYRQERFYFSDIVHIPWTTTVLDDVLFRFDILSSDDKQYALLTLQADTKALKEVLTNPMNTDSADQSIDIVAQLISSFEKIPLKIYNLLSEAYRRLSLPEDVNNPNQSLKVVVSLQSAQTNISHYFSSVEVLETRSKIVENVKRYNLMILIEKGVAEVLRLYKIETEIPARVQKLDTNVNPLLDEILGVEPVVVPMATDSRLDTLQIGALLSDDLKKTVKKFLVNFASRLAGSRTVLEAKNMWKEQIRDFEEQQKIVASKATYNLVFRQVDWLFQVYMNEDFDEFSPVAKVGGSGSMNDDEDDNNLETFNSFEKELDSVGVALERVYIAEIVRDKLTQITLTTRGKELISEIKRDYRKTFQGNEPNLLLDAIDKMFDAAEAMAKQTKKFFNIYNDKNISLSEKSLTLTREFVPIQQQFQKIELLRKEYFAAYGLDFLLINKLSGLMSSAESVLKSLRASLKPDELQKLDSVAKQLEFERLSEVNKQLTVIKGQLKDSLDELQLSVKQAEKVDSESRKYEEKLGNFSKQADMLSKRIKGFRETADAAAEALDALGDVDDIAQQIEYAKDQVPVLDDQRRRIIELMPTIGRDLVRIRRDVENTTAEARAAEESLKTLLPKIEQIEQRQSAANKNYNEANAKIKDLVGKVDSTKKATESSLVSVQQVETTIDTTLATLKIRNTELDRKETESQKIVDNARNVQAKVNRNDVEVKSIDQQLARLIIASQRDTNDYDTLSQKIDFVFRNVNDIVTETGKSNFAFEIEKGVKKVVDENNKTFSAGLIKEIDKRIIANNTGYFDSIVEAKIRLLIQQILKNVPVVTPPQQQEQQAPTLKRDRNDDDDNDKPVSQTPQRQKKIDIVKEQIDKLQGQFKKNGNGNREAMAQVLKVYHGDYNNETEARRDQRVNANLAEIDNPSLLELQIFLKSLEREDTEEYRAKISQILIERQNTIEQRRKISTPITSFSDCLALLGVAAM